MVTLEPVRPLATADLEAAGMTWHTEQDGSAYLAPELVVVQEAEAAALADAASALQAMYLQAAGEVIAQRRYAELGIPANLEPLIEDSWAREDPLLLGRFDLAGGLAGEPVKLLEFNADTPTGVLETSLLQWLLLKVNGLDEERQFNDLHETLQGHLQASLPARATILFSSLRGLDEDEATTRYLQTVAHEAGFFTDYGYLDEAGFADRDGVFNRDGQRADLWFKLYPWDLLAAEELEVARLLAGIQRDGHTRVLNPAYSAVLHSKGLLPVLHELFPDSPYLLPASAQPLPAGRQVRKGVFSRQGAQVSLFEPGRRGLAELDADADKAIYQAYVSLPQDAAGRRYQAGVYVAGEPCALGIRRGGEVLDESAQFIAHRIG